MNYVAIRDHIRQNGIIPKNIKTILKIATHVYDRIPRKSDTTLQKVLKVMSIADVVESQFQTKRPDMSEHVRRMGLSTTTNTVFTTMFFGTKLQELFELERYVLDGNVVIEASNPEFGKLLFIERWEKQYSPTFYHSPNFSFEHILNKMWDLYDGRLQFEITWGKSTYTTFSAVSNPLYGLEKQRMDHLVSRHKRYLAEEISRAYMFYGAPGTGKTSFAMEFASRIGPRIMRIDARSFSMISVAEVIFLIEAMRPDFIMVDDVDKADVNNSLPTILGILQEMKVNKTKTSLILTANTVACFDHGLLRPGRIDTWITFDAPSVDERREILQGYLRKANVNIAPRVLENFVRISADLTQDYLREIAQRLKHESVEEVEETIMSMRKLLRKSELPAETVKEHANGATNGVKHA